jgi:hypothetical protein
MSKSGGAPPASTMVPVVNLQRPVYDQEAFGLRYRQVSKPPPESIGEKFAKVKKSLNSKQPSAGCLVGGLI